RRRVALELLEVLGAAVERARYDVADELLLEPHVRIRVVPRDLGLDHPELGQVPARLGLLGAERGAEAVDLAEGGGGGLDIQLAGLGEVGAFVEVIDLEQAGAALADRAGQYRRIDADEVALVEEVVDRLFDLVPDAQDGALLARAEPEVPVVQQEVDAVLLGLYRVILAGPDDAEIGDGHLVAARRARILP